MPEDYLFSAMFLGILSESRKYQNDPRNMLKPYTTDLWRWGQKSEFHQVPQMIIKCKM